jgi:hypothetical protein
VRPVLLMISLLFFGLGQNLLSFCPLALCSSAFRFGRLFNAIDSTTSARPSPAKTMRGCTMPTPAVPMRSTTVPTAMQLAPAVDELHPVALVAGRARAAAPSGRAGGGPPAGVGDDLAEGQGDLVEGRPSRAREVRRRRPPARAPRASGRGRSAKGPIWSGGALARWAPRRAAGRDRGPASARRCPTSRRGGRRCGARRRAKSLGRLNS